MAGVVWVCVIIIIVLLLFLLLLLSYHYHTGIYAGGEKLLPVGGGAKPLLP